MRRRLVKQVCQITKCHPSKTTNVERLGEELGQDKSAGRTDTHCNVARSLYERRKSPPWNRDPARSLWLTGQCNPVRKQENKNVARLLFSNGVAQIHFLHPA